MNKLGELELKDRIDDVKARCGGENKNSTRYNKCKGVLKKLQDALATMRGKKNYKPAPKRNPLWRMGAELKPNRTKFNNTNYKTYMNNASIMPNTPRSSIFSGLWTHEPIVPAAARHAAATNVALTADAGPASRAGRAAIARADAAAAARRGGPAKMGVLNSGTQLSRNAWERTTAANFRRPQAAAPPQKKQRHSHAQINTRRRAKTDAEQTAAAAAAAAAKAAEATAAVAAAAAAAAQAVADSTAATASANLAFEVSRQMHAAENVLEDNNGQEGGSRRNRSKRSKRRTMRR